MKKLLILLVFCDQILFSKNLGYQNDLASKGCTYVGEYIKGSSYDAPSYIKRVEVSIVRPFTMKVRLKVSSKQDGNYYSIIFYEQGNKKYAPIKDLSIQPDEYTADSSASVNFRTFYKTHHLKFAPVIYKKGFRGNVNKSPTYINYMREYHPITDLKGNPVGNTGNFFTYLMNKNIGLGGVLETEDKGFITEDDNGYISFFVHLNSQIKKEIFVIISYTKISMVRSERGLRSPIRTSAFNPSKSC